MRVLDNIRCHNDLNGLNSQQQKQLCDEIREFLVAHLAKTGGHLASNLGVVELSVAIETVFDTNIDRLVFDVGHQSYVHKLLTGRQADFDRLRQFGGIAGFPKPSESNTDAFVAGHASSSVSIALGMARARTLMEQDYSVVALLGDGAATGGMVFEGLNDASVSKEPMVIILNDNDMSIDQNVGGLACHLSRLRTRERYLGMKSRYRSILRKIPGGKWIYRSTSACKNWFKRLVLRPTIFEKMGLKYMGPIDGHNLQELIRILRVAKNMNEPVVVHVITKKGCGYAPAEDDPAKFHGIGRFQAETGLIADKPSKTFSETFGDAMVELAREDPRVCAITAAMPTGTGLLKFGQTYPERLFDVGIAEEHAVSMAGGLAKQGMIPVVALYSTFLQRAFDQIQQDISMLNLHAVFAVDRAGLVGEDGETHHGVFDVGFLRQMPGMTILCPCCCRELESMLTWAVKSGKGPVAVRYPRGADKDYAVTAWNTDGKDCAVDCCRTGNDVTIITYGTMTANVMKAADILSDNGVDAGVLRLLSVSPLPDGDTLTRLCKRCNVLVVEETMQNSGIGNEIVRLLPNHSVTLMNLGDKFVTHGDLNSLYQNCGLDAKNIAQRALEVLKNEN